MAEGLEGLPGAYMEAEIARPASMARPPPTARQWPLLTRQAPHRRIQPPVAAQCPQIAGWHDRAWLRARWMRLKARVADLATRQAADQSLERKKAQQARRQGRGGAKGGPTARTRGSPFAAGCAALLS